MKRPTDFAYHLTNFFSAHLPGRQGASLNTILAYRDAFAQFLGYLSCEHALKPDKTTVHDITRKCVEGYLLWIEVEKKNAISTRNQRLSAIHSFYRYLQLEAPEHLFRCGEMLSIPMKKHLTKNIDYLTPDGIKAILASANSGTGKNRRDTMLLTLLYDSGARVSEIIGLHVQDVRLEHPATVRLLGKGNKIRIVPMMDKTAMLLISYMTEYGLSAATNPEAPLFSANRGEPLTRSGVRYIFDKYVEVARQAHPAIIPPGISPHSFRHSKAVHLLQADVNIIYIRDFLGHSDIKTTEHYAKIDSLSKRTALERASFTPVSQTTSWSNDSELRTWLASLGR